MKLMIRLLAACMLLALAAAPAVAAEQGAPASDREGSWFHHPVFSAGLSYPLLFSASAGAMLPLGDDGKSGFIPTSVSLRMDGEVGIAGGDVSLGLFIPAWDDHAVNLKAARMRTWLWSWNDRQNRTYDGALVELVKWGHMPFKYGLGVFKDTKPINSKRETMYFVFFGVGW